MYIFHLYIPVIKMLPMPTLSFSFGNSFLATKKDSQGVISRT